MQTFLFSKRARYVLITVLIAAMFGIGYVAGRVILAPPAPPAPTPGPAGAGVVQPPLPLTDFTLTSQTGEPINLSDLRGKVTLLFFGYTHCPEECPTTLANFKRVKESLGDLAAETAFVFVSVDGARDTPAVVASYLANFDPEFIGMTGDDSVLAAVGREYGLFYEQVNAAGTPLAPDDHASHEATADQNAPDNDNYFVTHTSPAFLIDPQGRLRLVYFYGAHPTAMAEGVRAIWQEANV